MTTYTVQIEAGNDNGTIWQAVHPSENIESDGTAQDLADEIADNQTVANGDNWRILVWNGANADTSSTPDATHLHFHDNDVAIAKRTGRPPLDPNGTTRVAVTIPDAMLRSLDQRAYRYGNRSEQIRHAIDEHLRGAELPPTVTVTRDSDPQTVTDQITDVLVYLQHVSAAINQAGAALRWIGDEDFEHQFDDAEGRIGDLFTALSMAQGPYAQKAREAACAAIPEDV